MESRDTDGDFVVIFDSAIDSLKLVSTLAGASDSNTKVVDKRPYACFFTTAAVGTAGAALSAAIGSELLDVVTRHADDTRSIVEASSVGGVTLFAVYGVALCGLHMASNSKINAWAILALGAGLAALSGEIGGLMMGVEDRGVDYFTAPALGAAILGSMAAVGLKAYYRPS